MQQFGCFKHNLEAFPVTDLSKLNPPSLSQVTLAYFGLLTLVCLRAVYLCCQFLWIVHF
jgi:hypothetical protein